MASKNKVSSTTYTPIQLVIGEDCKIRIMTITADASSDIPVGTSLSVTGTAVDSGTTNGATTPFELIQSGQNFETTVDEGDLVYNSTDATYAFVESVESDTLLILDKDIMATGENYTIYSPDKACARTGNMPCIGLLMDEVEADAGTPDVSKRVVYQGKIDATKVYDPALAAITRFTYAVPGLDFVPPTFLVKPSINLQV